MKVLVLYRKKNSYQRLLFRYGERRMWLTCKAKEGCFANWRFNFNLPHFSIITPVFRLERNNGQVYFGLGNHYLEIGY